MLESIPRQESERYEHFTLHVMSTSFWCVVVSGGDDINLYVGFPKHDGLSDERFDTNKACVHINRHPAFPSKISLNWLGWDEQCCTPEYRPMATGENGTVLMAKAAITFAAEHFGLEDPWTIEFMDTSTIDCKIDRIPGDSKEHVATTFLPEFYALTNAGQTWYQKKLGAEPGNASTERAMRYVKRLLGQPVDEEPLRMIVRTTENVAFSTGNIRWFLTFDIKQKLTGMVSLAIENRDHVTWGEFFSYMKDGFKCPVFAMFLSDMSSIFPDWPTLSGKTWIIRSETVSRWNLAVESTPLERLGVLGGREKIARLQSSSNARWSKRFFTRGLNVGCYIY